MSGLRIYVRDSGGLDSKCFLIKKSAASSGNSGSGRMVATPFNVALIDESSRELMFWRKDVIALGAVVGGQEELGRGVVQSCTRILTRGF